MKSSVICVMVGLVASIGTVATAAPVDWQLTATNTLGVNANDFHVVFAFTGGSVRNVVLTDIAGGDGVASLNGPLGGANGIDVVWATTVVMPGQSIKLDFQTDFPGIEVVDAHWTWGGANVGAAAVALTQIPAPGALGALLAGCGVAGVRRRR